MKLKVKDHLSNGFGDWKIGAGVADPALESERQVQQRSPGPNPRLRVGNAVIWVFLAIVELPFCMPAVSLMEKLGSAKTISKTPCIDQDMPIKAFVLVTTKPGTSQEIVRSRRIRGVKMANSVFGQYDAVLVIEADDLQELTKIVYEIIEQHPNVVHTETLISLLET